MGYWTLRYWLWAIGDKERERLHGSAAVFCLRLYGEISAMTAELPINYL